VAKSEVGGEVGGGEGGLFSPVKYGIFMACRQCRNMEYDLFFASKFAKTSAPFHRS
jgi:hypothetical protein